LQTFGPFSKQRRTYTQRTKIKKCNFKKFVAEKMSEKHVRKRKKHSNDDTEIADDCLPSSAGLVACRIPTELNPFCDPLFHPNSE
jgi:hypothetical protein